MTVEEVYARLETEHATRIAHIPQHLIKRTYPQLKRLDEVRVLLELWTEYWPGS